MFHALGMTMYIHPMERKAPQVMLGTGKDHSSLGQCMEFLEVFQTKSSQSKKTKQGHDFKGRHRTSRVGSTQYWEASPLSPDLTNGYVSVQKL